MNIAVKMKFNEALVKRVNERLRGAGKKAHPHRLTLGIHEAEASRPKLNYDGIPTDTSLIVVAFAHEFGLGVPQRSFIRAWVDRNVERLRAESTEAMRAEYAGDTTAVRERVEKWWRELLDWIEEEEAGFVALSLRTIADRVKAGVPEYPPLKATGQLVRAIRAMADGDYVG